MKIHANINNPISALNVRESPKFSGLRNTMVTSDFRSEVELWPYRASAMKNMQYNPYLMTKSQKFL